MTPKRAGATARAVGCKPSNATNTPRETPRPTAKSTATPTPARADAPPRPDDLPGHPPRPDGGMGDADAGTGAADGTLIGGVAQGRGHIPRKDGMSGVSLRVGMRVRNASGRGVWGFGSIYAVIPAGVSPCWYCKRHKLPMMFGEKVTRVWRDRCIVKGDDGKLYAPRNVEVCDGQ